MSKLTDPVDTGFIREFQQSTLAGEVSPAFFETIVGESRKVPARVWRAIFAEFLETDFSVELATITSPTVIMWGDQDAFSRRLDQDALRAAIPGSRLQVYSGAGHAFHWEDPSRFAADLVAFVNECAKPAT